jgi:hypothetical protein
MAIAMATFLFIPCTLRSLRQELNLATKKGGPVAALLESCLS